MYEILYVHNLKETTIQTFRVTSRKFCVEKNRYVLVEIMYN